MFNNQKKEESIELLYNPDPLINRIECIVRLCRELKDSPPISEAYLHKCIHTLLSSIEPQEEQGSLVH